MPLVRHLVQATLKGAGVEDALADGAEPLPPRELTMAAAAAEHGRGIALMAVLMDGVRIETDAAGSFHLLLEKGLRPAAEATEHDEPGESTAAPGAA